MTDHNAIRREITVKVCNDSCYDVPTKLWEAIAWFQEKLDQVPVEFYDKATLDIYVDSGDNYPSIKIDYTRLETDAEFDSRREKEKSKEQIEREKELKLLEILQNKYPEHVLQKKNPGIY